MTSPYPPRDKGRVGRSRTRSGRESPSHGSHAPRDHGAPSHREREATAEARRFGLAARFAARTGLDWDEGRPRLLAWAKEVADRLAQNAVEVDVCVSVLAGRSGSGEVVTFSAVAGDVEGVQLALKLDTQHVEVSLEVEPARAPSPRILEAVLAQLPALPEQFMIGSATGTRRPIHDALEPSSRGPRGAGRLQDLFASGEPIWLGWSVPRQVVVRHSDILDEQLADALVALGPLFKLLATRDLPGPPSAPGRSFGRRVGRLPVRRTGLVTEVDPDSPVEKGAEVRVLAGPFVGKVGVVQELDGKGGAKVMLGLLATRVEVKDLIATAKAALRPKLSSSHRRPLPSR